MPTDGVDDNCTFLGEALAHRGYTLKKARVEWPERGWARALYQLWRDSAEWRGRWVVLQFTVMAWSRRGFPFGAWAAMWIVRRRGAHTAVFYHEPRGVVGTRLIDRVRNACQEFVIRRLYCAAERPIFADPLEQIPWLAKDDTKAIFIPVGASVPEALRQPLGAQNAKAKAQKTVVVYCVDPPPHLAWELEDISQAIQFVSGNGLKIRLMFFGRGTEEAKHEINRVLSGLPVELVNLGIQSAEAVSQHLAESDVMLCVRGKLFPRRSSAIAGITCGVPMIAYAGACEGTHVAEAGVDLVPYRDTASLSQALKRLLEDPERWNEFHRRSVQVHEKYLSWNSIAERFVRAFGLAER
jgi:glycosyltransferase involved in cell wall biosynthesis